MEEKSSKKIPEGLGGWLILLGIGVALAPFTQLLLIGSIYRSIFQNGSFQILTTPGTEAYHPFWALFIIGELVINSGLVIVNFYLIYLFFTKKQFFPKLFIYKLAFSFMLILIDIMLVKIVWPNESIFNPDTTKELMGAGFAIAIWVPYIIVSKRVKVTFVR